MESGAMIKIWFQKHTITKRLSLLDDAYDTHFKSITDDNVVVEQFGLPPEAFSDSLPEAYVRYGQAEALFAAYFARMVLKAEREGFDAFIIGTSQDPGRMAALSLASIPVLSYGHNTFSLMVSQGLKFGIVGFIPELRDPLSEVLRTAGGTDLCVGFRYIESGRDAITEALVNGSSGRLISEMERAAHELKACGADVIIPGEGLENEILWKEGIRELAGIPFIDSNGLLIRSAVEMVRSRRFGLWDIGANSYEKRRLPAAKITPLLQAL